MAIAASLFSRYLEKNKKFYFVGCVNFHPFSFCTSDLEKPNAMILFWKALRLLGGSFLTFPKKIFLPYKQTLVRVTTRIDCIVKHV